MTSLQIGDIFCDNYVNEVLWDFRKIFVSLYNEFLLKKISINCRPRFRVDCFLWLVPAYKSIALTNIWHYELPSVKVEALIYWNSSSNLFSTLEPFFTSSSRTNTKGLKGIHSSWYWIGEYWIFFLSGSLLVWLIRRKTFGRQAHKLKMISWSSKALKSQRLSIFPDIECF